MVSRCTGTLLFAAALTVNASVSAADWLQWRGPLGTGQSDEVSRAAHLVEDRKREMEGLAGWAGQFQSDRRRPKGFNHARAGQNQSPRPAVL